MRGLTVMMLAATVAFACDDSAAEPAGEVGPADAGADATTTPDGGEPDDDLPIPAQGFQIRTPPITVPSGTEGTWCYYFTVPTDAAVGVKRWQSRMTAGSHHLIVYFTPAANQRDGTIEENCSGFGSGITNVPVWSYSSQSRSGENVMPPGVGMTVGAQQHGYVQMHYLNPTLEPLEVHVTVNADTFAPGEAYTQAAAFVTFNTNIHIPAGVGQTASAEGTCRVKDGLTFFLLSTHAHKRAVATEVKDGATSIFASQDWEHPGAVRWNDGYTFSDKLTYRCDYVNDRDEAVTTGASAEKDEMCMAVGYFYPAQRPIFCINSLVVSQ